MNLAEVIVNKFNSMYCGLNRPDMYFLHVCEFLQMVQEFGTIFFVFFGYRCLVPAVVIKTVVFSSLDRLVLPHLFETIVGCFIMNGIDGIDRGTRRWIRRILVISNEEYF